LEDEFGRAVGQGQIAQFIQDHQLGAGVAAEDPSELAAGFGFLQFVGQRGEGGEADAAALVAGADRQRCRQVRFSAAGFAVEDDALAVIDPGALRERGDRGLWDLGVIVEAELLQAFDDREARVDQPATLASFGAFLVFCFEQRGEVGDRGLLLA
jgi:hypothetical protein